MIGNIIKEYLVGLGVKIDKPGFQAAETSIKSTGQTIRTETTAWSRDFTQAAGLISAAVGTCAKSVTEASAIITTSIAGTTTAIAGLMKTTANQDLEMEKFSRRVCTSPCSTSFTRP